MSDRFWVGSTMSTREQLKPDRLLPPYSLIVGGMLIKSLAIAGFVVLQGFAWWIVESVLLGVGTALVYPTLHGDSLAVWSRGDRAADSVRADLLVLGRMASHVAAKSLGQRTRPSCGDGRRGPSLGCRRWQNRTSARPGSCSRPRIASCMPGWRRP